MDTKEPKKIGAEKLAVKRVVKKAVKKEPTEEFEKVVVKKVEQEEVDDKGVVKKERYYEAVGRRKTSTARIRLFTKGTGCIVNGKDYKEYFGSQDLQRIIDAPLKKMKSLDRFRLEAKVSGGGTHSQSEAIRHAISRVLVVFNVDFRKRLKRAGYLKRDPRMKERKKFGLKKARKSPRWSKR